ncbi:hypothetical protein A4X09_0g4838 [Tilletia walkeri]|uniref:Uncharacterized protein n=1 Tax=Tilletia walkeri TaxID=117179 RepID=A0A8X7T3H4_9BASI|nr:hypothetical protein A4X09_0g4838 [Tilletia walkeri]
MDKRFREKIEDQKLSASAIQDIEVKLSRKLATLSLSTGWWVGTHVVGAVFSGGATIPFAAIMMTYQLYDMMSVLVKHHAICSIMRERNIEPRKLTGKEIITTAKYTALIIFTGEILTNLFDGAVKDSVIEQSEAVTNGNTGVNEAIENVVQTVQADPAGAAHEALPYIDAFVIESAFASLASGEGAHKAFHGSSQTGHSSATTIILADVSQDVPHHPTVSAQCATCPVIFQVPPSSLTGSETQVSIMETAKMEWWLTFRF